MRKVIGYGKTPADIIKVLKPKSMLINRLAIRLQVIKAAMNNAPNTR